MKKFLLGLSILWIGGIGMLITYVYTLLHQGTLNGESGWIVNFVTNETGVPMLVFLIVMITGIIICVRDGWPSGKEKEG